MVAPAASTRHPYDEYLALERATDTRHEFLAGEVWAMAGGTPLHSAVKANAIRALGNALANRHCREFDSDQKIRVEATDLATYPDASVICGDLQRSPVDRHAAVNPTLLVEVLSPSTTDWDLGGKFRHYTQIPALREVLYISPEDRAIELRTRQADGSWLLRKLDAGQPIVLASLQIELTFEQVFAKLEGLEEPAELDGGRAR